MEVQDGFPVGSLSQMCILKSPDLFPLHVGNVSAQATLQDSARRQFLQTQLSSEDNETILSRDRVLDIECDSDFNFSFDLDNFCSDAGSVESNVKSVISSPPDEASPNVKDRLSKNIEFWCEIGASPWVLKVLEEGYAIPFLEMPPKVSFKNNMSALNHP